MTTKKNPNHSLVKYLSYFTQDEKDLLRDLLSEVIRKNEKTKKRMGGNEWLKASEIHAKRMNTIGLIDHLKAQTALDLIKKLGIKE